MKTPAKSTNKKGAVEELYGSLKTDVPYVPMSTARKITAYVLEKKYEADHSKYHSSNAFCGNAGLEEMRHLLDLIEKLTDLELKDLTKNVGIKFLKESDDREQYEMVIDEADREIFYREYRKIIESRSKTKTS